jgi:hypothetical protein
MAAACERFQVARVVLPDKLARPSLKDRVVGRTLAALQARLPSNIVLVDADGVLADPDQRDVPGPVQAEPQSGALRA